MKIFISVDIEGVAGVSEGLQGTRGNSEYEVARRLMTEEANAAIRGAFSGGAKAVWVADSHGPMKNIIAEDLDPRARLISGKPRPLSMIDGLTEDFDGAVFVGYHAAADDYGTLSHTISGAAFRRIEINGLLASETTLFGGHAASLGVPLLAVSGDDCLAKAVGGQFPATKTIVVKNCIGASAIDSLSPIEARKLIEAGVEDRVKHAAEAPTEKATKPPLDMKILFTHQLQADAVNYLPFVKRVGPREIVFNAASYAEAISCIAAMGLIAGAVR